MEVDKANVLAQIASSRVKMLVCAYRVLVTIMMISVFLCSKEIWEKDNKSAHTDTEYGNASCGRRILRIR
jgi:hypothetical protein